MLSSRQTPVTNDALLVKLLQLDFEHNNRINAAGEVLGCSLDRLIVDLLGLVWDALGVPRSSDDFDRGWLYQGWDRIVRRGTAEECRVYLQWVRSEMRDVQQQAAEERANQR